MQQAISCGDMTCRGSFKHPKDQSQFSECISRSLTDVLSSGSCPLALQKADLAMGGGWFLLPLVSS